MPEQDGPDDGGIYAEGRRVMVRPKRTERGITMGGPIAEAQNVATAAEIARRCDAFVSLVEALKEAERALAAVAGRLRDPLLERQRMAAACTARLAIAIAKAEGQG